MIKDLCTIKNSSGSANNLDDKIFAQLDKGSFCIFPLVFLSRVYHSNDKPNCVAWPK